jgi:hypothetical protein
MEDLNSLPSPHLQPVSPSYEEEEEENVDDPDSQRLLPRNSTHEHSPAMSRGRVFSRKKAFFVRALALLCACSLSIGSH